MASTLGTQYPWIQHPLICSAPMRGSAGGQLAAAVTNASGLGFIGLAGIREKDSLEIAEARKHLRKDLTGDELAVGLGFLCFAADLEESASLVREHKPCAVWLFSVHDLHDYATWTAKLRSIRSETRIWIQTGSVADAREIARMCRPDTIVLQGADAGGHGAAKGAGIISLLPEVADALAGDGFSDITLVAAGGIADHRGLAASIALGAAGVTMGTRFLASEEVKLAHPGWRDAILAAQDGGQSTLKARVFDDMNTSITWPAWFDGRALRNSTSKDWDSGMSTEDNQKLFKDAANSESKGYAPDDPRATVWAGTGVGLVRQVLPAGEIVEQTRIAAKKLLDSLNQSG